MTTVDLSWPIYLPHTCDVCNTAGIHSDLPVVVVQDQQASGGGVTTYVDAANDTTK